MVDILIPILSDYGVDKVKVIHGEKRLGDVMRNYSDTSKARRILGWSAKTTLKEGLIKTVDWFFSKIP